MQYATPQLRGARAQRGPCTFLRGYGPDAEQLYALWRDAEKRESNYVFSYRSSECEWSARLFSMPCAAPDCDARVTRTLPYCAQHLADINRLALRRTRLCDRAGERHRFAGVFAVGAADEIVFRAGQAIVPYLGEQFTSADVLFERYGSNTAIYGFANNEVGVYTDGALVRGIGASINAGNTLAQNNATFRECAPLDMITATRDIYGGEEILVDYGESYEMDAADVRYSTERAPRNRASRYAEFALLMPLWS